MKISVLPLAALTAVLLASAPPSALAGESEAALDQAQGLRVVRDAATGELRAPTDAELRELLAAERRFEKARSRNQTEAATGESAVVVHESGMLSMDLGPEYLVQIGAETTRDGSLSVTHDDPAHEHPVSAPAAAPLVLE